MININNFRSGLSNVSALITSLKITDADCRRSLLVEVHAPCAGALSQRSSRCVTARTTATTPRLATTVALLCSSPWGAPHPPHQWWLMMMI